MSLPLTARQIQAMTASSVATRTDVAQREASRWARLACAYANHGDHDRARECWAEEEMLGRYIDELWTNL